ncbi:hypothetical protein [Chryseobacterium sp. CT-SW4]|uniref:hypothetical protein n=1 Tax=Chryseobacterium sp. SW-1 TaxID=3157343 RepID=UPI003B02914A
MKKLLFLLAFGILEWISVPSLETNHAKNINDSESESSSVRYIMENGNYMA